MYIKRESRSNHNQRAGLPVLSSGQLLDDKDRIWFSRIQSVKSILMKISNFSEETLSNVRTVRAFANEQMEVEKFSQLVQETQALYQRLGLGIALFQVSSNFKPNNF